MDARAADDRHPLGYRPHDGSATRRAGKDWRLQKFPEPSGGRLRTRPSRLAAWPARRRAAAVAGLRDAGGIVWPGVHADAALETHDPPFARRAIFRGRHHLPVLLGAGFRRAPTARLVVVERAG